VYILKRLRPANFHEIISVGSTPANALSFIEHAEDKWVISYKGEPTYVFGSHQSYPHVRHIFGLGTDRTTRIIPYLTKFVRTAWGPMHFGSGTLRIEVRVPVSCSAAIGWLMKLGMKPECSLAHFSITGEQYMQLAYTKDDFDGRTLGHEPTLEP
jgi:hypothetical protein